MQQGPTSTSQAATNNKYQQRHCYWKTIIEDKMSADIGSESTGQQQQCSDQKERWSYYDKSDINSCHVDEWHKMYPCGDTQSPVNLDLDNCRAFEVVKYGGCPLQMNYSCDDVMNVTNTGQGVKFSCFGKSTVTGGPLGQDVYQLVQFHFHWGACDHRGSEHLLCNQSFPAELHLVHFNQKYQGMDEALKHQDGLCVVGVFIQASSPCQRATSGFKPVFDVLPCVAECGSEKKFCSHFDIARMLPCNTQHYTHYKGSLTTPPLNEAVMWINMIEEVFVPQRKLELFRKLMNPIGKPIIDNYRPVQPLNKRKIEYHKC